MKIEEFIRKTSKLPVIESEMLLAGVNDPLPLKVQMSRWKKAGKLIQLRRGIYLLPDIYRKIEVDEFFIASILEKPSYVSMEKALEYHSLIPDAVPVYTCLTTKRPGRFVTEIGVFEYRHIKRELFWGYESLSSGAQTVFIASPEKALLDLIYMRGMKISTGWLRELRLQNVSKLGLNKLNVYAAKFKSLGMLKAAGVVKEYIGSYEDETEVL